MIIDYVDAKPLIKEADVLLFHNPPFPQIGWWIAKYSNSPYSHAGLATILADDVYCVEFREFIGSRIYPMQQYIKECTMIDVFRPVSSISIPTMDGEAIFYFDENTAIKITNFAKGLIGQKYGWKLIWKMAKAYLPFVRLHTNVAYKDRNGTPLYVCSTLVAYSYRKFYVDPIPFLADDYTKPGDLARSVLFEKIFSIRCKK